MRGFKFLAPGTYFFIAMEAEDDDVKSKIEDDEVASPSTNKDSVERHIFKLTCYSLKFRNGQTPLVNRRANRSMLTAKSSAYLVISVIGQFQFVFSNQDVLLTCFVNHRCRCCGMKNRELYKSDAVAIESLRLWTPTKMFMDGDDSSKVLLMDMRSSLITSRMSTHSSQSLPSIEPLNDCLAQMPTVQKVAFK